MKTAISLPDDLFREIDRRARALNLSRSAFLARAARELIERTGDGTDATEAWNRAVDRAGQPGDEAGAAAARRRTKRVIRSMSKKGSW